MKGEREGGKGDGTGEKEEGLRSKEDELRLKSNAYVVSAVFCGKNDKGQ